jgi:hypothetical protein
MHLLGIGLLGPQFGSEDPLAPVEQAHWYHQELSEAAALATGWSTGAAAELGRHASGVDLYNYHPVWRLSGGWSRWQAARLARPLLNNIHFDNLASTAEIAEVWQRTVAGTLVGIEWAAQQDQVAAARQLIGVSLHSIQDFYSHSTWIDDPVRREKGWLESGGSAAEPDLCTGGFGPGTGATPHRHGDMWPTWRSLARLPAMLGLAEDSTAQPAPDETPHPPPGMRYGAAAGINLDSRWQARIAVGVRQIPGLDADAAFDTALTVARRESRFWLARLDRRFGADPGTAAFWHQVRNGPQGDWTEPYTDPAVLAYGFIAVGPYPPSGRGPDGWFHRVLATPLPGHRQPRAVRVRMLDAHGRELGEQRLPVGRVATIGSPPDTARLELSGAGLIQVQAFRRSPQPLLQALIEHCSDTGHPFRIPIDA